MAHLDRRRQENIDGDFYVDDSCIDCDQCRRIAPATFTRIGEQSAVHSQPGGDTATLQALQALVTCPTSSIGTQQRHDTAPAAAAFPENIDGDVFFCGFAAESSFGASSYFIRRPAGNVLVDSPRFAGPLVKRIEALGGLRTIFLTHRDDVADHEKWSQHFGAERVLHADDVTRDTENVERKLHGDAPTALADDLLVIPTPGHTRGHAVLLYAERYLFSGDHLWWSRARNALVASRSVAWYSWKRQLQSVERLLRYRFEWLLPGHGGRQHADADRMHACIRDTLSRAGYRPTTAR